MSPVFAFSASVLVLAVELGDAGLTWSCGAVATRVSAPTIGTSVVASISEAKTLTRNAIGYPKNDHMESIPPNSMEWRRRGVRTYMTAVSLSECSGCRRKTHQPGTYHLRIVHLRWPPAQAKAAVQETQATDPESPIARMLPKNVELGQKGSDFHGSR
jgi:hypothetical protein